MKKILILWGIILLMLPSVLAYTDDRMYFEKAFIESDKGTYNSYDIVYFNLTNEASAEKTYDVVVIVSENPTHMRLFNPMTFEYNTPVTEKRMVMKNGTYPCPENINGKRVEKFCYGEMDDYAESYTINKDAFVSYTKNNKKNLDKYDKQHRPSKDVYGNKFRNDPYLVYESITLKPGETKQFRFNIGGDIQEKLEFLIEAYEIKEKNFLDKLIMGDDYDMEGLLDPTIDPTSLLTDLVAYFHFENDLVNEVDTDGTGAATPDFAAGKSDTGATFVSANSDGVTYDVADNVTYPFSTNFWLNISAHPSANQALFSINSGTIDTNDNICLYDNADSRYHCGYSSNKEYFAEADLTLGTFNMVTVIAYSVDRYDIFINAANVTKAGTNYYTPDGDHIARRGSGSHFGGQIDEFAVWNKKLNSSELDALYDSGTGQFYPFSTADTTAPTFASAANATGIQRYSNITMNITISDETALSSYIFSWNDTGSWINDSAVTIAGTTWAGNTSKNITAAINTVVSWRYYANDTSNNWADSGTYTFTVPSSPPTFSNAVNATGVNIGNNMSMNITISDNLGISSYIFSWNDTGSWVNDSAVITSGTSYQVNTSKTVTSDPEKSVGWRMYANDTDGEWAASNVNGFIVDYDFKIIANDLFNGTAITSFNTLVTNGSTSHSVSTNNNKIYINQSSGIFNVSVWKNNAYYNITHQQININQKTLNASLYTSKVYVNTTWINGTTISSFNSTVTIGSNSSTGATTNGTLTIYSSTGTPSVAGDSASKHHQSTTITTRVLAQTNITLNFTNNNLTIAAFQNLTGNPVLNYDVTFNAMNFSWYRTASTTTGNYTVDLVNDYYNVSLNASGYAFYSEVINVNVSVQNETFYLFVPGALIRFFYEANRSLANNIQVTLEDISATQSANYSTTNGTITLQNSSFEQHLFRHKASGYTTRQYYHTFEPGGFDIIDLYLVTNSSSTLVTVSVVDEKADPVEDVTVKALRYNLDTNTYNIVEIDKTNFEGETTLDLILNEELYKFILEYGGEVKKITAPTQILSNTIEFSINLFSTIGQKFFVTENIYHQLVFEPENNRFVLSYTDTTNTASEVCLTVERLLSDGNVNVGNSCSTDTAGELTVGVVNSTGASYKATATASLSDPPQFLNSAIYTYLAANVFGSLGLFLISILTMVFIGVGFWKASVGVVLTPVPLVFGSIMGIINISVWVAISVELLAIFIAYVMANRS